MTRAGLEIDMETESDRDVTRVGAYVYFESPWTDVKLLSYRLNGGPLKRWRRGQPCPADIAAHVEASGIISAHNAAFERLAWWTCLTPKHGWPKPKLEQFRCTAVTAAAMCLPRDLDRLGAALNLKSQKDKRGKALIRKYSMPHEWRDGKPIFLDDEAGLNEFHDYCDIDVLAESEADARLIPLSEHEQEVYWLNERINDRGIRLDVRSARAAVELAERATAKLDADMRAATKGAVKTCSKVADLKAWLGTQGISASALDKEDVEDLLEDEELPEHIRNVLEIRLEAAKTSVSKIKAMLTRVCADGRIRGLYLHHGAGQTGRFSSRGVQMHNPPRPRKEFEEAITLPDGKQTHPNLRILFEAIRTGDPSVVEFMYGPKLGRPLHLLSDAVRSFLWAAPGYEFLNADYSSIEGRIAAWAAGEKWKLEAFRALDRGEGQGIYEMTAANIFGVPVEDIDKTRRQGGKVAELSLGYQGGVGALARMARQNKFKLETAYGPVRESAAPESRERAEKRFHERLEKHDPTAEKLGLKGWAAGELIKVGWRGLHVCIEASWGLLEEAVTSAVLNPGQTYTALGMSYRVTHGFLWGRLPSGRCLAYGAPRHGLVEAPWADKTLPRDKREKKLSVTVMGVDSQTHKWVRFPVYGGALFNHYVQGTARDILVNGMMLAEAEGLPLVLHTHDEIQAEIPRGSYATEDFGRLICQLPVWADGLPLTASAWRGKRGRK